jgi:hypothetical protein
MTSSIAKLPGLLKNRAPPETRMPAHRFPPTWSVKDIGAAFVVKDGTGRFDC